ncbi:DUF924 domain-containing protein [Aliiglaciecola sp. CAU 1673]|uniref:DUF924 family protein n=1 Tax=Aliiglaciecola sp. CAU 1673 TaxID=3032595 RepID=UPI0023DA76B1|nr:DUF924 family protein [Aliiglaciecola sp. CAU 1673]MDF2179549.1 DUF924 domain-containing protein [Aliiglaciecola sp. CAU 1673]
MNKKLDEKAQEILTFWFGELTDGLANKQKQRLWYGASEQVDADIRERFGDTLLAVAKGNYQHWAQSPQGRLALILLFDQFSRNIYRGQAEAFAFDHLGLRLCQEGLSLGHDQLLQHTEKLFFYHPLEHAEDLGCQQQAVELFKALAAEAPDEPRRQSAESALKFVEEHRDIIAQFGRFPHRNAVLGRASNEAELRYLESGGKRFGQ